MLTLTIYGHMTTLTRVIIESVEDMKYIFLYLMEQPNKGWSPCIVA